VALALLFAGSLVNLLAQLAPKTAGFRGMFLDQLKDVESKAIGLAEATPQEKYDGRPEEGVRSIKEVFVPIAFANYFLPSFIGVKPPAGISPVMETAPADKAKVIETMKASFAHIRQVSRIFPTPIWTSKPSFSGRK
jgi:hypothetical protein